MALATLLHLGAAIRSLNPETNPNQALKTRVVTYLNPTTFAEEGSQLQVFLYTASLLVANRVYQFDYDGDEETAFQAITCATATPPRDLVVSTAASAAGTWDWFVVCGPCQCGVEGTTDVAKDDYLKLTSGTSALAFIKDGTGYTTSSHAIATEAQAANSVVAIKVILLGGEHLVA